MKQRKFKKCLITGISGSGGSYLAEHIYKKKLGIKIYGIHRSKGYISKLKKNCKKIDFFKIDLKNFNSLKKCLNKVKPDLIFHLASNADVRGSFDNPIEHASNNNMITVNLLEAVRQINFKPLIIICSTSEVYGNVDKKDMPITEKHSISAINPYAATKVYQDLISQIYNKSFNLKIIITRMFSYTNPRRFNLFQTSFAKQIVDIEKGKKKIVSHGNLSSIRTFVDIDDAMEAYWLTATRGRIGEIYNICGKKIISVHQYLNELIKLSTSKIYTKLDKQLLRPQDVNLQIASCKKFINHTKWKPKVKFKDSVQKLLNELRQNK